VAGRDLPHISIAGFVLYGAIQSHSEHALRHRVPTHRAHASRNSGEAYT
jgi:hypothetical protein